MNWILAFNVDFIEPEPMSKDEAENAVQSLASKASRQFTKGKTAYKELNDALSASYDEAVSVLMDPASQSTEAQQIVFSIISDEASVFGSSVPQDQIANIKKAVINKVKSDYSLPVYKLLDGEDKDATEARIDKIIVMGIEAAGSHVAGEDEVGGYSTTEAKDKYDALQEAFTSLDKEYSQVNKSLSKLGMANLYALIGNGDEVSARALPYATLQIQLQNMKGEFESGAEIENIKHLASDVFASDMNRAQYDSYLDLSAKEDILKKLEARSSNGAINPKLFMEATMQFNALYGDAYEALMLLYGFADSKELDTGTDFAMMESVLAMMNNDAAHESPVQAYGGQGATATPQETYQPQASPYDQGSGTSDYAYSSSDSPYQQSDAWRHKSPEDYTAEDFYNAYQAAKDWNDARKEAKSQRKENAQAAGKGKSKTVAGVLAIFLGSIGAQKFYLGHAKEGVITILITVFGAAVFVGPLVTGTIGLVEGIKYLVKSPEDFRQTYELEGKKWF